MSATLALLAALVTAARSARQPAESGDASIERCELSPPRDTHALGRCLALLPRDVELMLDLGARYEADRAVDRAEEIYRKALGIDPRDGDAHLRLSRVLLARGDADAAARHARLALDIQPGRSDAQTLLAQAAGESGR